MKNHACKLHCTVYTVWCTLQCTGVQLWRLLNMKNLKIVRPDIYMHEECHKVQETHFKNRCCPVHSLGVAPDSAVGQLKWSILMLWSQPNKLELISTDRSWKNRLDRPKCPTKIEHFFSLQFFRIFSMMVLSTKPVYLLLNSMDQDTSCKPSNTLWTLTGKKKEKLQLGSNYFGPSWRSSLIFNERSIKMSSSFLCCNKCIKTLHLNYQTTLSNDFQFSLLI